MNGTATVRERLCLLAENALAWFIESGAIGVFLALGILAAVFGNLR